MATGPQCTISLTSKGREYVRGLPMRCPELNCRAPMVRRTNRLNGTEFYGCSRWPDCDATRPIPERERMLEAGACELPGFSEVEGGQV